MKNNKGLSQVVTTLIIILLVLVAIGIIWGVVSNLLDKSKITISSSTRCMDLDVKATKIEATTSGSSPYDDPTLLCDDQDEDCALDLGGNGCIAGEDENCSDATEAVAGSAAYKITFKRSTTGGDISGVKVVVYNNASENTEVMDSATAIGPAATLRLEFIPTTAMTGEAAITKIEVTPYFTDDSGTEVICSVTATKEF
jgi:hypothetical protein